MSTLEYFTYDGFAEQLRDGFWYNQAVKIGDRIECSGQGGWDPATGKLPTSITAEIDQAFSNVDLALRTAGGQGWSQVYKIHIYMLDIKDEEAVKALVRNMKKWMPNHKPILTVVGVKDLALEGMRIEVEVAAVITPPA
ncbi:endoribonuclease L-PSP [Coprinopsis cinerea okayama7|uniref:Endoribonuclease L-PSP n=1 Tax=Coprinopsis cinerea (strain Okayama-7 / 130 / ATCC MYA-4618 / FGSC 9003) TaxID=240176 RepID=A8MZY2_COPC7|nr:endoribonuclease L-PSP [Coprinopsis cinerea okayama7\|eukprot:XP_001828166.1 endoribonuclease L-PSP [Coprinopsis cinerea okayama7\